MILPSWHKVCQFWQISFLCDLTDHIIEKYGWNYIHSRKQFDNLKQGAAVELPLLGLFANTDIPFEIDRRNMSDVYPSLDEMAQVALAALTRATKDSDKGFFLMIEGSRIDHAGHGNDPAAQVHEVLAYDKAFKRVIDFIDSSSDHGRLVSTSDHETGGLSVARRTFPQVLHARLINTSIELHSTYPRYRWLPEALSNASHSAEYSAGALNAYIINGGKHIKEYINSLVKDGLGIVDPTAEELDRLYKLPLLSVYTFAEMISRRARIGWATHGHSAVDVNIYAYPAEGSDALRGNHENTEIGKFLQDYLELDVEPITHQLRKSLETFQTANSGDYSWTGRIPSELELEAMFIKYEENRIA